MIFVVAALEEECLGLVGRWGLKLELSVHGTPQKIYSGTRFGTSIKVVVTGVLQHNAVSMLSKLLIQGIPRAVVNFGCVGAYEGRGLRIGEAFFVAACHQYDVDFQTEIAWYTRPFLLQTADLGVRRDVVCTTGSRFSLGQPGCDCEDMELYGLASLASAHEIPLYSVKYVANYCNEDGPKDFERNVVTARAAGEGVATRLVDMLCRKGKL
uniref:Nucleoside phosphorylase domain-containing protein n=1 Tax=Oxyrrhis marina TaxID=2969 RepID=A0A7S3XIB1_OXYMA|mmetsp:Transcript_842/g.1339  ORF Transcript_842/g.1339 Transcript_842/m.1339 type:complete len:211 (-) Transcript_842:19-651(-)